MYLSCETGLSSKEQKQITKNGSIYSSVLRKGREHLSLTGGRKLWMDAAPSSRLSELLFELIALCVDVRLSRKAKQIFVLDVNCIDMEVQVLSIFTRLRQQAVALLCCGCW